MKHVNIQMRHVAPNRLAPNPWNSNVVSPENEAKLEESISRLGMFKPVVVRTLPDGTMQILGGEHRASLATRMGMTSIPVIDLGPLPDNRAKEISLTDNSRYGTDDALQLAGLLESLGTPDELTGFLPYSDTDFASIFASVSIALDDLDDLGEPEPPALTPKEKPIRTHQIMRFKVPAEDVATVSNLISRIQKTQGFTEGDSLTNAGDALVHLCQNASGV